MQTSYKQYSHYSAYEKSTFSYMCLTKSYTFANVKDALYEAPYE